MNEPLYRSREDRVFAGLAGGLAEYFAIDPLLVRILWVVLAVMSGGVIAAVYVVMIFLVPLEPETPAGTVPDGPATTSSNPGTDWRAARAAERARRRADRARARAERQTSSGNGGILVGLGLILLGAWFLLERYVPDIDWGSIWPVLLVIIGLLVLVAAVRRRDGGTLPPPPPPAG